MWITTGDNGADLSKTISKKSLEIVLEAEILAALGVLNFRKDKTPKALDFTGFQRFLSSDKFVYFTITSEVFKRLENRLPSRAREFESHTLRQPSPDFRGFFREKKEEL